MARQAVEVAAVMVETSKLIPWVDNPRSNEKAVKSVAESINKFGFAAPIIARKEDGRVIAGHTRLKAAALLGLTKVPVRYVDLGVEESNLLALADNKLGEIAEWEIPKLKGILEQYAGDVVATMTPLGWSEKEIEKIMSSVPKVEDLREEQPTMPDSPNSKTLARSYSISLVFDDESARDEAGVLIARIATMTGDPPSVVVLKALRDMEGRLE